MFLPHSLCATIGKICDAFGIVYRVGRWRWLHCHFVFTKGESLKALQEKILKEGKVCPGNILKVGSFLNHRLDVSFIMEMGKTIALLYGNSGVNKILTIETSGIALAFATAFYMNVPVVFAKKSKTKNILGDDTYTAPVESFTHGEVYDAFVSKEFLTSADKLLLVDDFLANGKALVCLNKLAEMAGAMVIGAAVAIEKGFQHGGDRLRMEGLRIESLAIIESMTENTITFREEV
jgi:xanthine phosphoribosyltransferase